MKNPLDNTREDEKSSAQTLPAEGLPAESLPAQGFPAQGFLECCNSGCRFCVLDYPELFLPKHEPAGDAQVSDCSDLVRALERAEEILHHLDSEGEF